MDNNCNWLNYLCIYDINAKDIDRYAVKFLNLETPPKLMILEDCKEYNTYRKIGKFKDFENLVCVSWFSIKKLISLLKENKIKYLLIDAHRIPDVHIIIAAKHLNIKIFYIQHGMYIPFMKRTYSLFIKKFIKTIRYLYYTIDDAFYLKDFSFIKRMIDVHIFGKSRTLLDKYNIFPNNGAVYSKYWEKWHKTHYRFIHTKMFIMGNQDLNKFMFSKKLSGEYIAYCYQSLLEDGRISKNDMYEFYNELQKWSLKNKKKVIVKVHPVANELYLKDLQDLFGFELEYSNIPNTDVVIGHYSSLLPFWGINGRKVITVKLPGHDIHESISSWSFSVSKLNDVVLDKVPNVDANLCKYYFSNKVLTGTEIKSKFLEDYNEDK